MLSSNADGRVSTARPDGSRSKRRYPSSNSGLLWRMSLSWNVFKAKAGRLCQDFCGTVALVMIDLERSSDSLGPSVDSLPRQAKPMRRTTFGESNARRKGWWPWRSAEHLVTEFHPCSHRACSIGHFSSPNATATNL